MTIPEKTLEKLKKYSGIVYPPLVYKIERGMIERFIEAVEGSSRQRDKRGFPYCTTDFPYYFRIRPHDTGIKHGLFPYHTPR
jgi:hypothetical protein